MKRFLLSIIFIFSLVTVVDAAHIKGGFFTYKYLGPGTSDPINNIRYEVTLTVYMICSAQSNPGQLNNPINFSIFNGVTGQFLQNVSVPITNQYELRKNYDEPCLLNEPLGCYYYIVVYRLNSIELPRTSTGYLFSYQRCCRIGGIQNVSNSGAVGNTFVANIPGTGVFPGAETNNSPVFPVNDTAVVCRNSYFETSFQATDSDGDSLTYSFCDAYDGASQANPAPAQAANPPYSNIPYASPFTGSQPLGAGVSINPNTGVISGNAPDSPGTYVVCVCINEYKNGILIGTTRKELHIEISDCNPIDAQLNPSLITCDGFNVSFQNLGSNPPGAEFLWDFGDPASGINNTSTSSSPTHVFTDTGLYSVKLKISMSGGLCADSAIMIRGVYPGFFPGFIVTGNCFNNPFNFTDTTNTRYGVVNSWRWNFGDQATLADTSRIRNPQWTYPNAGPRTVTLIVTNSKGCVDTADVNINVLDKPPLSVAFRDTLICRTDRVQLNASGPDGVSYSWTPGAGIISGGNTGSPTVSPTTTTWYYIDINDNGCFNRDSVQVRVVAAVNLQARSDTTICQGDQVQLSAVSDGLSYSWSPTTGLSDPNIINPIATVNTTTTYTLIASVGTCRAQDQVTITTVPYPVAVAGPDLVACYNSTVQLNAQHDGSSFTWTPPNYLNNPNSLNPFATPPRTTTYVFSSFDNRGCPKPGRDTVVVTVLPRVRAFAGRDTSVVIGQPLQFNGSGGVTYTWSPSTGLSNPNIPNPIGTYTSANDTIRYKLTVADQAGCVDSAFMTVRIFQVKPTIFVPTAFTPNNDGLNDVVRPICVGIQKINYFSIYNRWGQLVFTTTEDRAGWDGRIKGRYQDSNVFVWMVSAVDYQGNKIFLKGTVTLIR